MSRSYRKTPKCGIAGDSDRRFKTLRARKLRRVSRLALIRGKEVPTARRDGDRCGDKDGKLWKVRGDKSRRK